MRFHFPTLGFRQRLRAYPCAGALCLFCVFAVSPKGPTRTGRQGWPRDSISRPAVLSMYGRSAVPAANSGTRAFQEPEEEIGSGNQAVDFRRWAELSNRQQALLETFFRKAGAVHQGSNPSLGTAVHELANAVGMNPNEQRWERLTKEHNDWAAAFLGVTGALNRTTLDLGAGKTINALDPVQAIDELHGDRIYTFVDAEVFRRWKAAGGGFSISLANGETETGHVRFDKGDLGGSLHPGYDMQWYTSYVNVPRIQWNYRIQDSNADIDLDARAPWKGGVIPNPRHLTYSNSDPRQWRHSYVRKFGDPGFSVKASAQVEMAENPLAPPRTLTAEQERQAQELAGQFAKRLVATPDVSPIVKDMFVGDFLDRYLQDSTNYPLTSLARDVAAKLDHNELLRYYVLSNNLYSQAASSLAQTSGSSADESLLSAAAKAISPDLADLAKNTLAHLSESPAASVTNADDLRALLATLEKAAEALTTGLPAGLAGQAASSATTPGSQGPNQELMKPWAVKCDEACFGYPAGTELVAVNVPNYQLLLVNDKGQLKIVSMTPRPN